MRIPYETSTAGDRALNQLQQTLAKFGCQSFGTMIDNEKGETIVQFKWRNRMVSLNASWHGYANALIKNKSMNREKAIAQAKISVCSVLRDWTKGQITAVECGVMSFETAFMPHMLLSTGERVIDRVKADNLLPAPEEKL
jgi:hypothetical protein